MGDPLPVLPGMPDPPARPELVVEATIRMSIRIRANMVNLARAYDDLFDEARREYPDAVIETLLDKVVEQLASDVIFSEGHREEWRIKEDWDDYEVRIGGVIEPDGTRRDLTSEDDALVMWTMGVATGKESAVEELALLREMQRRGWIK